MDFRNSHFSLRIRLYGEDLFFGPGLYQILKLVEETGSLANAVEKIGLSYTKAWKRLKTAEKELGTALLSRHSGGAGGGFSSLTAECRDLMRRYEGFERELNAQARILFDRHFLEEK